MLSKMSRVNVRNNASLVSRFLNRYFFERSVDAKRSYSDALKKCTDNYQIRNITVADIPKIAEVRKTLKLTDCISSLYTTHKLDPEAILIVEDEEGNIIGTHAMLTYVNGLYISGLTYVHQSYRKQHLAMEIICKAISRQRNNIGMFFAYEGWSKTLAQHFKFKLGYMVNRYISNENVDINLISDALPRDVAIHPFEEGLLDVMNDYDLQVAGYERPTFLDLSCNESHSKTLIALKNGQCVGFGSIKLACTGAKRIGPLYADDPEIAEALLKSLLKIFDEGKGFVIIVPSPNIEALKLVEKLNIPLNDGLRQVYDKEFPQADVSKVYSHFDVNFSSS